MPVNGMASPVIKPHGAGDTNTHTDGGECLPVKGAKIMQQTEGQQRTFTFGEIDHLASVVGDLAIDQFSNQREYREAIYRIFSCYVFNEKPVEKEGGRDE